MPFTDARVLEGVVSPRWREAEGGRAPRLGPREYIGDQITRRGRFRRRDPLQTARLPTLGEVAALVAWAVLVVLRIRPRWPQLRPFGPPRDG